MSFKEELRTKTEEIEKLLTTYLPQETGFQKTVLEAVNYSVLAGGKRLRPLLMKETYQMFGGEGKVVEPFMAAMEMIFRLWIMTSTVAARRRPTRYTAKPWVSWQVTHF